MTASYYVTSDSVLFKLLYSVCNYAISMNPTVALRNRLIWMLAHAMIARGDEMRDIQLADLSIVK